MPAYIALLRGVNVANKTIQMADLRGWLSALGFGEVRTYIQSGNALFTSEKPPPACTELIEGRLAREMRGKVAALLKTPAELAEVIARNPFLARPEIDQTKLHVTFLRSVPTAPGLHKLGQVQSGEDEFQAVGSEVYVYCPNGYGRTKLSNQAIERALSVEATTRNWNTVKKLHALVLSPA